MTGVAAIALAAAFTNCSKSTDLYDQAAVDQREKEQQQQKEQAKIDQIKASYEEAFINTFGQPSATHTWGFGSTRSTTRTITVNGDAYDKFPSTSEISANFPTAIPEDAVEVSDLLDKYQGQTVPTQYGNTTLYDLYAIYANVIKEGYNLKITSAGTFELGGNYQNAGWNGSANVAYPYNVYVDVDGDVTLKRIGATHFNLYILRGNVTLGSDYGEQAGLISVAAGATLNDQRNSIAANQGVKLYNRGTINATNTQKYDIGNFCTVYNEGKFNVSGALTYSPGDANTSYFVNLGDDAELTAPSMTLNSSGNFFNSGKTTITGETKVTQAGIYWVNDGHYTTGSMVFSAKNATFFNYCQLKVIGNAHMYDGEFNLMANSYTEAGTADFDNFIVNMGNNSGFNVLGNTNWAAQGDGTYQGFRTTAGATNAYVRLGGTTTVAGHLHSLELTGNITYAINNIVDKGAGNSGVQPTYVFNEGTTEAPFDKLTVTPNATGCGATWIIDGGNGYQGRIMAEDLNAKQGTDFDFNDVVFDWKIEGNKATIQLLAAGGIYPLYVGDQEVHAKFGKSAGADGNYPMINTGAGETGTAQPYTYTFPTGTDAKPINIPVVVEIDGTRIPLEASMGGAASKINTTTTTKWAKERADFRKAYSDFTKWVADENFDWTKTFDVNFLYTE